jgi:hypothetical protein
MRYFAAFAFAFLLCSPAAAQTVWTFDRLDRIGGLAPHVEGDP